MKKFALLIILLLAACGKSLDGTYSNGAMKLMFNSNKTVTTVILGAKLETSYVEEGGKIKFTFPGGGGNFSLTQETDGTLNGGIFGKFTKTKE